MNLSQLENEQARLENLVKSTLATVECNESTENYYCDGEISATEAKARHARFVKNHSDAVAALNAVKKQATRLYHRD